MPRKKHEPKNDAVPPKATTSGSSEAVAIRTTNDAEENPRLNPVGEGSGTGAGPVFNVTWSVGEGSGTENGPVFNVTWSASPNKKANEGRAWPASRDALLPIQAAARLRQPAEVTMDYSERQITMVQILDLNTYADPSDGRQFVLATVRIQLGASDDGPAGPEVRIVAPIKRETDIALVDVERQILSAALGILSRVASELPQSLEAQLAKTREPI